MAKRKYKSDIEWLVKEKLTPLAGGRIVQIIFNDVDESLPEDFQDWDEAGFIVEMPKSRGGQRYALFLSADPEGNGPGWVDVQELKTEEVSQ